MCSLVNFYMLVCSLFKSGTEKGQLIHLYSIFSLSQMKIYSQRAETIPVHYMPLLNFYLKFLKIVAEIHNTDPFKPEQTQPQLFV